MEHTNSFSVPCTNVWKAIETQAEAEVVPSSSLNEVEVEVEVWDGFEVGLWVVRVSDQDLVQHIKS